MTTSIYRAPLNYALMDYYDNNINTEIDIRVPVYLNVGNEFPDLVEASQHIIDKELRESGVENWTVKLIKGVGSDKDYTINMLDSEIAQYLVNETSREIQVGYNLEMVASGDIPELICGVILDHVFADEIEAIKTSSSSSASSQKIVAYSPTYHLTFSLFTGGGKPIEWDIGTALADHFTPLRTELSRVANLTIDTQVQYYSELAFELPNRITENQIVLDHDHLSTFINFGEWSLTSIHSYPTLHFILYIPSEDQSPMVVANSTSNSFSIPQWGGVVIRDRPKSNRLSSDDLLPVLETFSSQLLGLLGAPDSPKNPSIRIDFLSRISTVRALKASSSSLGSLYRLSKSLANIAIPLPVLNGVDDTLDAIKTSLVALKMANWMEAIVKAGDAMMRSESAFFDKMMVQQMFFPDEHKVAIYLPLLGPVSVVMLMGVVRVFKEYKEDKLAAAKEKNVRTQKVEE